MKRATIYDVARKAGVSHQTVTRYLNGFEGIRPATRERVQAALVELQYKPNSAARYLRSQQTNRIGILAHKMELAGPGRVIAGATSTARARGYVLDIVSMDGEDVTSVDAALDVILDHQIAGVFGTAQTEVVRQALIERALDVPIAIVGAIALEGAENPLGLAGRLAARHLIELGHRRVGFLGGPSAWLASGERRSGFLQEARLHGLDIVWEAEGDWSAASGFDAAASVMAEDGLTAIACANDSMAIGMISGLAERGLSVPGDISVIGMDDAPDSRYVLPALSTVRLDFEGEGADNMQRLIAMIEGTESAPHWLHLPPAMIWRDSSRPVGGGLREADAQPAAHPGDGPA